MPPVVSIIIPAYNSAAFLPATLEAIEGQTFTAWECFIVNDGSRDATANVIAPWLKRDRRFRYVRQDNAGVSTARNRGFLESHPESQFLLFQDADDIFLPNAIELLVNALLAAKDCSCAHGLAEWIDVAGRLMDPGTFSRFARERYFVRDGRAALLGPDEPTEFSALAFECRIYPPGLVLMRRQAFIDAGMFDPHFNFCADVDIYLRLALLGPMAFLDQVLVHYRRHAHNMSSNHVRVKKELADIHKKILRDPRLTPATRRDLRDAEFLFQVHKTRMWLNNSRYELRQFALKKAARCIAHYGVNLGRLICLYPGQLRA